MAIKSNLPEDKGNVKHTPGPWWIDLIPEESINGKGYHVAVGGDNKEGRSVAFVYHAKKKEQTLSNARLIAAAPDLLEALKTIANTNNSSDSMLFAGVKEVAKKAIAKAEGK